MYNGLDQGMEMGLGIVGVIVGGIMAILAILAVILFIAALVSILINHHVTGGGKLLWILGIIYLPVIGAVAWFVVGRKGSFNRLIGIDKRPEGSENARHATQAKGSEQPGAAPHFGGASPGPA